MTYGILGSGTVGQTLAAGLKDLGHEVMIGTRKDSVDRWDGATGSMAKTAAFGERIMIALSGTAAEKVLADIGPDAFSGKIVIDVTNPLRFGAEGEPPEMTVGYPDSLGARIQTLLPSAKIVKCFNIVTAAYMTKAMLKEGTPDMFIAGDDTSAKKEVAALASSWGWEVHDLGGIKQAYLLEALAMIWIRYGFLNNHWTHAFKLLKA